MTALSIKKMFKNVGRYAFGGFMAIALVSCGGGGGSAGTSVNGGGGGDTATTVGSVSLIFSSPELKSAGAVGTEVAVTALVKNTNNVAIADIPIKFSADANGALSNVPTVSDKNGQAQATLSTSGDHTNRRITVTVQAGTQTTTGTVDVVGTTVSIVGPSALAAGATGEFNFTVKDSAGSAIANVPVKVTSQKGNTIIVKTSNGDSANGPLTNSQGLVTIVLTASQSGNDTLTAVSQGVSNSSLVNVNASKLTVSITDGSGNTVTEAGTTTACQKINAHYEVGGVAQTGNINITTSRGKIFSDSTCSTQMASSTVALVAGDSQAVYLKSDTAGVATVTAIAAGGLSAQANVEFIAALTASATISLQAEPAVIGTNSGASTQIEQSTLTAVVRDGTANNNFVKNAVVEFTVLNDKSGGALSNPSVVTTVSNGSASVVFISGAADTPQDGVTIQAKIQGTSTSVTKTLTVAKKSLFIAAGTGNTLVAPSATTYQQDYVVFVTDASGNPVSDVTVTASAYPTRYRKGTLVFDPVAKLWLPNIIDTCANEDDANKNGILDAGEDYNGNGVLDPGIPLSVTSSGTTDVTGTAKISLLYPRDRAQWTEVKLTIHGSVSGTESTYQVPAYFLSVLSSDVSSATNPPPGVISPYGVNACNIAN